MPSICAVTSRRDHRSGFLQLRPQFYPLFKELVLRIAKESPSWGYDRIQGALANLGCRMSDTTVANILKAHGVEPVPDRRRQ